MTRQRDYQRRMRAAGRCIKCGKDAAGMQLCLKCRYVRSKARNKRAKPRTTITAESVKDAIQAGTITVADAMPILARLRWEK